jgi:hypothetical protein
MALTRGAPLAGKVPLSIAMPSADPAPQSGKPLSAKEVKKAEKEASELPRADPDGYPHEDTESALERADTGALVSRTVEQVDEACSRTPGKGCVSSIRRLVINYRHCADEALDADNARPYRWTEHVMEIAARQPGL